ncbi:MAG: hypothetical protein QXH17_07055 [Candidatus Bathyarchaeia archaeon]
MDARFVEQVELGNGLILEIWDESRLLVGDRWVVTMMARIKIPLDHEIVPDKEGILDEIRHLLGDHIYYIQRKTRNFISEKDVPQVFGQLKERFLEAALPYLSHPSFPVQFMKKKWEEIKKHAQWGEEYVRKDVECLKGLWEKPS